MSDRLPDGDAESKEVGLHYVSYKHVCMNGNGRRAVHTECLALAVLNRLTRQGLRAALGDQYRHVILGGRRYGSRREEVWKPRSQNSRRGQGVSSR